MPKELTDEYTYSNSCDTESVGTETSEALVSATGIPISKNIHSSFLSGTTIIYGAVAGKTTGTFFSIKLITAKYAHFHNSSLESLLSFLDIINNKDGW